MTARADSAKAIFLDAIEKHAPEAWPAFLDDACAGDAELRAAVEKLLQARRELGTFHEQTPPTLDPPDAERPGAVIGPYKLLQQIGEGGMGVVYLAEQSQPVQRQVALKIIKPGLDSRQILARFEAERQALALMDHPNIAKVLDAGCIGSRESGVGSRGTEAGNRELGVGNREELGEQPSTTPYSPLPISFLQSPTPYSPLPTPFSRPFFVMELVRGVPITQYCDEHHLTPKQRLDLFIPVCQAVQHAHQKGIIHRDLKPSNVLVAEYDDKPVAKVIDFGVAKAVGSKLTDKTMFTEFGQVVGTLEYMSPEQAKLNALDIDTRSDIYALGVLLYELLTGTTPFDKNRLKQSAFDEVLRIIREEDPPKPSTRLSTTDQLPSIAANRGSEPKRLSGSMRGELDWIVMKCLEKDRNRRYETANGLAMDLQRYLADEPVSASPPSAAYRLRKFVRRNKGAVIAASIVGLTLVAGVIGTSWQAVRATRERDEKEQARKEAVEQTAITKAVNDFFLNDLLAQADMLNEPFVAMESERNPKITVRELLDRAAKKIDGRFPDQPLTEAAIRQTTGCAYLGLGLYKEACKNLERSLELRRALLGPDHEDTLSCTCIMANCYEKVGRYGEALKLGEELWMRCSAALGPEHPMTLESMSRLAITLSLAGRPKDALDMHRRAFALTTAKCGANHPATLIAGTGLALCYLNLRQSDDAIRLLEEVLSSRKSLNGPRHWHTQHIIWVLSLGYRQTGRLTEAIKLLEETISTLREILGDSHPMLIATISDLATCYDEIGRRPEALNMREQCLTLIRDKVGADHPKTLGAMNNLAISYDAVGQHDKALEMRSECFRVITGKLGAEHPNTLLSMNNLAISYATAGRDADAIKLFEECLAIQTDKLGAKHADTLKTMGNLADALATASDSKVRDPQRALQLALTVVEGLPNNASKRNTLGAARYAAGDWQGAIADFEKSMELLGPDSPNRASDGFGIARCYWQLGDKDKARAMFAQAVEWMEKGKLNEPWFKNSRSEAAKLLGIEDTAVSEKKDPQKSPN